MIKLPTDLAARVASFTGLGPERKAQIVSHLQSQAGTGLANSVMQIRKNGGPEAAFINHLLAPVAPAPAPAPAPVKKPAEPPPIVK